MTRINIQKFPEVFTYSSGSVSAGCAMTGSQPCSGYSQIVGNIYSSGSLDSACGLKIWQSVDGGTYWDITSASQVATAGFTTSCMVDIIGNAVKVAYKNGEAVSASLRLGFYLKPVAGTAKMPDVDIDVVTEIAELTAGSVAVTAGSINILESGSIVMTSGSITSGSLDVLNSGSIVMTSGSITAIAAGLIDTVTTVGTVSSITAGSVDIDGALPTGTNSIGDIGTVGTVSSITAGSVDVTNIPDPIVITFEALTAASMGNASSASIVAVSASRRGLIITNTSDTTGYLSIGDGTGLTASNYLFRVGTGETIEFSPPISQQAIASICGSASKNVAYQEAT